MTLFDVISQFYSWVTNFVLFYINIDILGVRIYFILVFIFISTVVIRFTQKLSNRDKKGLDK